MAALANALTYTLTGLAVFALWASLVWRTGRGGPVPATEAAVRVAAVLGGAIIIAATMH